LRTRRVVTMRVVEAEGLPVVSRLTRQRPYVRVCVTDEDNRVFCDARTLVASGRSTAPRWERRDGNVCVAEVERGDVAGRLTAHLSVWTARFGQEDAMIGKGAVDISDTMQDAVIRDVPLSCDLISDDGFHGRGVLYCSVSSTSVYQRDRSQLRAEARRRSEYAMMQRFHRDTTGDESDAEDSEGGDSVVSDDGHGAARATLALTAGGEPDGLVMVAVAVAGLLPPADSAVGVQFPFLRVTLAASSDGTVVSEEVCNSRTLTRAAGPDHGGVVWTCRSSVVLPPMPSGGSVRLHVQVRERGYVTSEVLLCSGVSATIALPLSQPLALHIPLADDDGRGATLQCTIQSAAVPWNGEAVQPARARRVSIAASKCACARVAKSSRTVRCCGAC
jgi:hypothetical protein